MSDLVEVGVAFDDSGEVFDGVVDVVEERIGKREEGLTRVALVDWEEEKWKAQMKSMAMTSNLLMLSHYLVFRIRKIQSSYSLVVDHKRNEREDKQPERVVV